MRDAAATSRRRLYAVMSADAAGFSRLMVEDDASTVAQLEQARAVFRDAIESGGGRVIDMAGDSVLAVFESAALAVDASAAVLDGLQRRTPAQPPEDADRALRYRIGIDLGDVLERPDGTVYGDAVNLSARLQALAPVGGVAVSRAVHDGVPGPWRQRFADRGRFRVKHLAEPLQVFMWRGGGTATAADPSDAGPVADTPDASPARLPPAPSMLGRDAELRELIERARAHRLVSLLGSGGMGKTTLALAAAHAMQADWPGGCDWVDLAALSDPALLVSHVARGLGVAATGNRPLAALTAALAGPPRLLVLDNAEHLLQATAELVQALRDGSPALHVLVTTQAPLNLQDEEPMRLEALSWPASGSADPAHALAHGAVSLFVAEARRLNARFALTPQNVDEVVAICAALEGVALAIKLAAARLPLLGLRGLHARIHQPLQLLAGGARDLPPRQRTLRAALDWSYGLLAPEEQRVFRRLGALLSGFTLELAAHAAGDNDLDEWAVVDAVGRLLDRSLLVRDYAAADGLRLLESARDYAQARLEETGEAEQVHRRAADALRGSCNELGREQPALLAHHLEASGQWDAASADWERAAQQAQVRQAPVEAAVYLQRAVELQRRCAEQGPDASAAQRKELALRLKLGPLLMLTRGLGSAVCEQVFGAAADIADAVGTPEQRFMSHFNLWFVAESQLRLDEAQRRIGLVQALAEQTSDDRYLLQAHHAAYTTAGTTGRWDEASAGASEVYRRYRPADAVFHRTHFAGHDPSICSLGTLANANYLQGRSREALQQAAALELAMAAQDHLPSRIVGGFVLCLMHLMMRQPEEALRIAEPALVVCRRQGLVQYEGMMMVFVGWSQSRLARDRTSAELAAAGLEKFASTGTLLRVSLLRIYVAEALGAAGCTALAVEQARLALSELRQRQEFGWHGLALVVLADRLAEAGDAGGAEAAYQEAIKVAEAQRTPAVALRAATGLGRRWIANGNAEDARCLVEHWLDRVQHVAGQPDYDEARALLAP